VTETWVRWHEVPDFLDSDSFDFHYVMDHIQGEIRFGDNTRGMIPPAGSGNVQASYRTGGGAVGNRKPGEIVALKTTVPYVDKVSNHLPAEGGVDVEQESELLARGPRVLRHRNRAVTREDYEDMAMLASREVARAMCVPLRHLKDDPDGRILRPGALSIIIVPRSDDDSPFPSPALLETVDSYLDTVRVPTAEICVVGPEYVRMDVAAEIGIESLDAGDVELAVVLELKRFLHPLRGGFRQNGWEFGRRLYASELYSVIERIPGVRYIASLEIQEHEQRPGASLTGTFLISSGEHQIRLFLAED
jgi:predicted phage baseplate assembly protein